jgi:hypothetical protein
LRVVHYRSVAGRKVREGNYLDWSGRVPLVAAILSVRVLAPSFIKMRLKCDFKCLDGGGVLLQRYSAAHGLRPSQMQLTLRATAAAALTMILQQVLRTLIHF